MNEANWFVIGLSVGLLIALTVSWFNAHHQEQPVTEQSTTELAAIIVDTVANGEKLWRIVDESDEADVWSDVGDLLLVQVWPVKEER